MACPQVYSVNQARQDIDAVYSTGLFENVNISPQATEDSTLDNPKVGPAKGSELHHSQQSV